MSVGGGNSVTWSLLNAEKLDRDQQLGHTQGMYSEFKDW